MQPHTFLFQCFLCIHHTHTHIYCFLCFSLVVYRFLFSTFAPLCSSPILLCKKLHDDNKTLQVSKTGRLSQEAACVRSSGYQRASVCCECVQLINVQNVCTSSSSGHQMFLKHVNYLALFAVQHLLCCSEGSLRLSSPVRCCHLQAQPGKAGAPLTTSLALLARHRLKSTKL